MHSDDSTPDTPDDEAARGIEDELEGLALTPDQREALLRRILERIGGEPPLASALPPKAD